MTVDLKDLVQSVCVLNLDEEVSTITPRQLLWNYDDNGTKSFIVSDVDHELLILIQFNYFVHLKSITIQALSNKNNDIDMSQPHNVHIYSMEHLNISFEDIHSFKPHKSIKLSSKTLCKGHNIILNKKSKNTLKFNKIQYIAIFIESNQNNTDKTYLNGLKIIGIPDKHKKIGLLPTENEVEKLRKLLYDDTPKKKQTEFPQIIDNIKGNEVTRSDSLCSTKILIDGYLRCITYQNNIDFVIPNEINIICLNYFHFSMDFIMNHNHLLSIYEEENILKGMDGSFGCKYYIYKRRTDDELFTVKYVKKSWNTLGFDLLSITNKDEFTKLAANYSIPKMYENEINILKDSRIHHPNILNVVDIFETNCDLYIFYNYHQNNDQQTIHDRLEEIGGVFDEYSVKVIIKQLLYLLVDLHKLLIVHRFITIYNIWFKSRNSSEILLMNNEMMDIVPKNNKNGLNDVVGDHYYLSPEMIEEKRLYNTKTDIWSCGVLIYITLCGHPPFFVEDDEIDDEIGDDDKNWIKVLHNKIKNGEYDMSSSEWDNISDDAKYLINMLLTVDPNIRFTAKQALNHKWLQ